MSLISNPYALLFFVMGLLVVGALAISVSYRRGSHTFAAYATMVGATATHILAYAFDLASPSLEWKIVFHKIVWFGFAITPSAVLVLALRFADKPVSRALKGALVTFSLTIALLAWTDEHHRWLEGAPTLVEHGGYLYRVQARGPAFWAYFIVSSACALSALAIFGATWLSGPALQRRQARVLFFALIAPWAFNFVFLIGGGLVRFTPLALGASALAITGAFLRDGFLDLVPVAHDAVIASLGDPIIVLDRHARVVDANPAARALAARALTIGAPVDAIFPFLVRAR